MLLYCCCCCCDTRNSEVLRSGRTGYSWLVMKWYEERKGMKRKRGDSSTYPIYQLGNLNPSSAQPTSAFSPNVGSMAPKARKLVANSYLAHRSQAENVECVLLSQAGGGIARCARHRAGESTNDPDDSQDCALRQMPRIWAVGVGEEQITTAVSCFVWF